MCKTKQRSINPQCKYTNDLERDWGEKREFQKKSSLKIEAVTKA